MAIVPQVVHSYPEQSAVQGTAQHAVLHRMFDQLRENGNYVKTHGSIRSEAEYVLLQHSGQWSDHHHIIGEIDFSDDIGDGWN